MKKIKATLVWFVEVEIDEETSPDKLKETLCEKASEELVKGEKIIGPFVFDCNDKSVEDIICR